MQLTPFAVLGSVANFVTAPPGTGRVSSVRSLVAIISTSVPRTSSALVSTALLLTGKLLVSAST